MDNSVRVRVCVCVSVRARACVCACVYVKELYTGLAIPCVIAGVFDEVTEIGGGV